MLAKYTNGHRKKSKITINRKICEGAYGNVCVQGQRNVRILKKTVRI